MDKFERIGFVLGMSLIVIGLMTLFDGDLGHSKLHFNRSGDIPADGGVVNSSAGLVLPDYDIILINDVNHGNGLLDLSLSRKQEEDIRRGLRLSEVETACDLQGKRPDRILWGQKANQDNMDSLSVYTAEKLVYLGSYLDAWKIQAQGGSLTCYSMNDQTAKLLTEL